MGKQLAANVYVDDVLYVKGAEPPKEVADQIVNPKAWDDGGSVTAEGGEKEKGYVDYKVDELKQFIADRNEGREEDDLISDEGKKADLVAALEADDEQQKSKGDDGNDDAGNDE